MKVDKITKTKRTVNNKDVNKNNVLPRAAEIVREVSREIGKVVRDGRKKTIDTYQEYYTGRLSEESKKKEFSSSSLPNSDTSGMQPSTHQDDNDHYDDTVNTMSGSGKQEPRNGNGTQQGVTFLDASPSLSHPPLLPPPLPAPTPPENQPIQPPPFFLASPLMPPAPLATAGNLKIPPPPFIPPHAFPPLHPSSSPGSDSQPSQLPPLPPRRPFMPVVDQPSPRHQYQSPPTEQQQQQQQQQNLPHNIPCVALCPQIVSCPCQTQTNLTPPPLPAHTPPECQPIQPLPSFLAPPLMPPPPLATAGNLKIQPPPFVPPHAFPPLHPSSSPGSDFPPSQLPPLPPRIPFVPAVDKPSPRHQYQSPPTEQQQQQQQQQPYVALCPQIVSYPCQTQTNLTPPIQPACIACKCSIQPPCSHCTKCLQAHICSGVTSIPKHSSCSTEVSCKFCRKSSSRKLAPKHCLEKAIYRKLCQLMVNPDTSPTSTRCIRKLSCADLDNCRSCRLRQRKNYCDPQESVTNGYLQPEQGSANSSPLKFVYPCAELISTRLQQQTPSPNEPNSRCFKQCVSDAREAEISQDCNPAPNPKTYCVDDHETQCPSWHQTVECCVQTSHQCLDGIDMENIQEKRTIQVSIKNQKRKRKPIQLNLNLAPLVEVLNENKMKENQVLSPDDICEPNAEPYCSSVQNDEVGCIKHKKPVEHVQLCKQQNKDGSKRKRKRCSRQGQPCLDKSPNSECLCKCGDETETLGEYSVDMYGNNGMIDCGQTVEAPRQSHCSENDPKNMKPGGLNECCNQHPINKPFQATGHQNMTVCASNSRPIIDQYRVYLEKAQAYNNWRCHMEEYTSTLQRNIERQRQNKFVKEPKRYDSWRDTVPCQIQPTTTKKMAADVQAPFGEKSCVNITKRQTDCIQGKQNVYVRKRNEPSTYEPKQTTMHSQSISKRNRYFKKTWNPFKTRKQSLVSHSCHENGGSNVIKSSSGDVLVKRQSTFLVPQGIKVPPHSPIVNNGIYPKTGQQNDKDKTYERERNVQDIRSKLRGSRLKRCTQSLFTKRNNSSKYRPQRKTKLSIENNGVCIGNDGHLMKQRTGFQKKTSSLRKWNQQTGITGNVRKTSVLGKKHISRQNLQSMKTPVKNSTPPFPQDTLQDPPNPTMSPKPNQFHDSDRPTISSERTQLSESAMRRSTTFVKERPFTFSNKRSNTFIKPEPNTFMTQRSNTFVKNSVLDLPSGSEGKEINTSFRVLNANQSRMRSKKSDDSSEKVCNSVGEISCNESNTSAQMTSQVLSSTSTQVNNTTTGGVVRNDQRDKANKEELVKTEETKNCETKERTFSKQKTDNGSKIALNESEDATSILKDVQMSCDDEDETEIPSVFDKIMFYESLRGNDNTVINPTLSNDSPDIPLPDKYQAVNENDTKEWLNVFEGDGKRADVEKGSVSSCKSYTQEETTLPTNHSITDSKNDECEDTDKGQYTAKCINSVESRCENVHEKPNGIIGTESGAMVSPMCSYTSNGNINVEENADNEEIPVTLIRGDTILCPTAPAFQISDRAYHLASLPTKDGGEEMCGSLTSSENIDSVNTYNELKIRCKKLPIYPPNKSQGEQFKSRKASDHSIFPSRGNSRKNSRTSKPSRRAFNHVPRGQESCSMEPCFTCSRVDTESEKKSAEQDRSGMMQYMKQKVYSYLLRKSTKSNKPETANEKKGTCDDKPQQRDKCLKKNMSSSQIPGGESDTNITGQSRISLASTPRNSTNRGKCKGNRSKKRKICYSDRSESESESGPKTYTKDVAKDHPKSSSSKTYSIPDDKPHLQSTKEVDLTLSNITLSSSSDLSDVLDWEFTPETMKCKDDTAAVLAKKKCHCVNHRSADQSGHAQESRDIKSCRLSHPTKTRCASIKGHCHGKRSSRTHCATPANTPCTRCAKPSHQIGTEKPPCKPGTPVKATDAVVSPACSNANKKHSTTQGKHCADDSSPHAEGYISRGVPRKKEPCRSDRSTQPEACSPKKGDSEQSVVCQQTPTDKTPGSCCLSESKIKAESDMPCKNPVRNQERQQCDRLKKNVESDPNMDGAAEAHRSSSDDIKDENGNVENSEKEQPQPEPRESSIGACYPPLSTAKSTSEEHWAFTGQTRGNSNCIDDVRHFMNNQRRVKTCIECGGSSCKNCGRCKNECLPLCTCRCRKKQIKSCSDMFERQKRSFGSENPIYLGREFPCQPDTMEEGVKFECMNKPRPNLSYSEYSCRCPSEKNFPEKCSCEQFRCQGVAFHPKINGNTKALFKSIQQRCRTLRHVLTSSALLAKSKAARNNAKSVINVTKQCEQIYSSL